MRSWNEDSSLFPVPDSLGLSGMEQATGFRCGVEMEPGELSVTVPPGAHSWTTGLERDIVYGTYGDVSPDDIKYHTVLGLYATNKQGFRISLRFFIQQGGESLGSINDLPGKAGKLVERYSGKVLGNDCSEVILSAQKNHAMLLEFE